MNQLGRGTIPRHENDAADLLVLAPLDLVLLVQFGPFVSNKQEYCLFNSFLLPAPIVTVMSKLTSAGRKLSQLRDLLAKHSLAAYIIPTADAHQSEYVGARDKRRAYLTAFDGSAGTALVTGSRALLWTDGRYFLQASKQLDPAHWELMKAGNPGVPRLEEWLAENIGAGQAVGFDPFLLSTSEQRRMASLLQAKRVSLVPVHGNLIDEIWPEAKDASPVVATSTSESSTAAAPAAAAAVDEEGADEFRPAPGTNPVMVHLVRVAGKSVTDKLNDLRKQMHAKDVYATVVCALDEIAWLYNVRGSDIAYNPVFLSYAIVTDADAFLYVDQRKIDQSAAIHLYSASVTVKPYEAVLDDLKALGETMRKRRDAVKAAEEAKTSVDEDDKAWKAWFDPIKTNVAVTSALGEGVAFEEPNPIAIAKALKNEVEIQGMVHAHIRDGVSVSKFLAWLEAQLPSLPSADDSAEAVSKSPLTEYSVATRLREFREEWSELVGLSFGTISSIGANGAIIHYSPSATNSAPLTTGKVFLLDSGGQYRDGTTDITRTVFLARPGAKAQAGDEAKETDAHPSAFQKETFTRVLQGHIALACATFPPETMGPALDVLARTPLWKAGLNYLHGTGHGVGSFLNVHEGPHGIAPMNRGGTITTTPLRKGMVVSNEPGYYHDGEFGIRIENLIHVVEKPTTYGKNYLGFENLTLVPIDRSLIEMSLLTKEEIAYLDDYHKKCRETLLPLLDEDDSLTKDWIMRNTEPLAV